MYQFIIYTSEHFGKEHTFNNSHKKGETTFYKRKNPKFKQRNAQNAELSIFIDPIL